MRPAIYRGVAIVLILFFLDPIHGVTAAHAATSYSRAA